MGKHAGTDTIELIFHKDKPKYIRETYVRSVCNIIPHKIENHRTRLTAGGNIIDYPGDVSTPTSDLTTMKIHVNSAISDVKARCIGKYMKYFYRNGKMMDKAEYIMI